MSGARVRENLSERDLAAAGRGPQHGVDRAGLTERIGEAEAGRVLTGDGTGEVVELACVRVRRRDVEVLRAPIADGELDAGGDAVPGVADAQDSPLADRFELAAIGQIESAVEVRQDVALVGEGRDQTAIEAGRAWSRAAP